MRLAAVVLLVVLCCAVGRAAVWYVAPEGSDVEDVAVLAQDLGR